MSISLDQCSQLLVEAGISSSQLENEILIEAKRFTTRPEMKEELTFEESCISDEEHLFEHENEGGEEGIAGDQNHEEYHANKRCMKQCFQVNTRLIIGIVIK